MHVYTWHACGSQRTTCESQSLSEGPGDQTQIRLGSMRLDSLSHLICLKLISKGFSLNWLSGRFVSQRENYVDK